MARNKAGFETRDRILEAVRALLASEGFEGVTIKAVCERAGIQAGSFYNLFESKEDAILEVIREAIDAVDPDPAHVGIDTVADLRHAYVEFITGQPALARVYIRIGVASGLGDDDAGATFLAHHRRRVERFGDAICRETPELDEAEGRDRAELMLATLNGLAVTWLMDSSIDFAGLAERMVSVGAP
jgi:AcrR family transcriptional regulator